MSNSWANVHSFLDMMDNQDLHSPLSSSLSSFSSSSISNCSLQLLSIEAKRWHEAERVAQQLLFIIQPNKDSENRREEIIEYLQTLIEDAFGIKVFPFGSVPLKTYLPDGDIDLTAINHFSSTQDLPTEICSLLENEAKNNTSFRVKNVLCVPAQVRVVKCTVDGIRVDISFNQTAGLCALYFFEQVDRFIGKDHLFKRSVILIKAWCYYESRILGGFHGLISTYALETMVLHVINLFHSSLQCPLAVLNKFLEYYGTFDWNSYCVGFNGLVLLSSFPDMIVQPPPECDEPLLTDAFLWSSREAILSSMGVGPTNASFTKKFLNILDPLRDDNNLGRSVSKGNFYRIQSALSYGAGKLSDILMLPVENIQNELEKYFKDTLMINGKRRRGDVVVPVSTYDSEIPDDHSGHDHLFSRIDYGLWFQDHGMIYPAAPETSKNHEVWNHKWIETGHNVQFDHNMYYNFNKSPRSFYSLTSFAASNAASGNEKPKSRGTGTFIPYIRRILRRNKTSERNEHNRWREPEYVKENEIEKEYEVVKMVDAVDYPAYNPSEANLSLDEARNIDAFSFSLKEFPVLPGGKPIPIEVAALSVCPETTLIKEPSASLDDSLEFDSFKHSSLRSMLSEAGKHSESDETVILDLVGDPSSVIVPEDPESSESVEKLVVPVEALQLADDLEFPPLSRPPETVITLNKKEFPPLRSCLKSNKRNKPRKDFKEAQ